MVEPDVDSVVVEQTFWEETESIQLYEEQPPDEVAEPQEQVSADEGLSQDEVPQVSVGRSETAPEPKISQLEAMKQALADLGMGAKNADLAQYILASFGLQPKNIAVLKSAAKKALLKNQQDSQEPAPAAVPVRAVEETLRNGVEESPPEAGHVLPSTQPATEAPAQAEPRANVALVEPFEEAAEMPSSTQDTMTFSIDEVLEVKQVCDRIGASTVLELLDLFGW